MKVLMLGWEFPPFQSGGLGTACRDLCKGLSRQGIKITFVMPQAPDGAKADAVRLVGANSIAMLKVRKVRSLLRAYQTSEEYTSQRAVYSGTISTPYGKNLFEEVHRLANAAEVLAAEPHDVIHVHDWMTYPAGIAAKKVSGRPIVAHIHATEDDRTGGHPNPMIKDIEKHGLQSADIVVANSKRTKENVLALYGLDPEKVVVVHWGLDHDLPEYEKSFASPWKSHDKLIVFLGRLTVQKGPEYFIEAAKRVLECTNNVRFVVAGGGDMLGACVQRTIDRGLQNRLLFTGAIPWSDAQRLFQAADLFVMPSVSEPFGLVALEALKNGAPIIVSRQSGVSEVVQNCLKVDFWDIEDLAAKMISVVRHTPLREELQKNGCREVLKFNLDEPARKVIAVYERAIKSAAEHAKMEKILSRDITIRSR